MRASPNWIGGFCSILEAVAWNMLMKVSLLTTQASCNPELVGALAPAERGYLARLPQLRKAVG
jgi:hypothetical protein